MKSLGVCLVRDTLRRDLLLTEPPPVQREVLMIFQIVKELSRLDLRAETQRRARYSPTEKLSDLFVFLGVLRANLFFVSSKTLTLLYLKPVYRLPCPNSTFQITKSTKSTESIAGCQELCQIYQVYCL